MVTFVYAVLGIAALSVVFFLPVIDALSIGDWARSTWLQHRFGRNYGVVAPPPGFGGRAYAAAFAWAVVLFLGALALPR